MFKREKDQFFLHLANISANLTESTNYFSDYKLRNTEDLAIFSEKMKDYEKKATLLSIKLFRI